MTEQVTEQISYDRAVAVPTPAVVFEAGYSVEFACLSSCNYKAVRRQVN